VQFPELISGVRLRGGREKREGTAQPDQVGSELEVLEQRQDQHRACQSGQQAILDAE
jgi:hypothetical protein